MNPVVESTVFGVAASDGAAERIVCADEACGIDHAVAVDPTALSHKSELATRLASKIVKNSRDNLLKIVADPNADEQLWLSAWQEHKEHEINQRNKQTSLRVAALEFLKSVWSRFIK